MGDHPFRNSVDGPTPDYLQLNGHDSSKTKDLIDGSSKGTFSSRADELQSLLVSALAQTMPFIQQADSERRAHENHQQISRSSLVDSHSPSELRNILTSNGILSLPERGTGHAGLAESLSSILKYSVNTSASGFLDKLYAAPLPPGIVAELLLGVLNTNVHVYQVSPVLSLIERHVTKALANMFGFTGSRAGGINVQGGSASNMTSIVIARNTLFPETKQLGNTAGGRQLVMFTSDHGHYSIEKAAQQCGFGSDSVISVPVDPVSGEMNPRALEDLISLAKSQGKTPFYINATAGTTVLGSFDPFSAIARIAKKHGLWLHIDGAWGGSFVFSETLRNRALKGCELADSIAINPHKMMGVPVTCSFLLLEDLKKAHSANTLRAGYLFHDIEADHDDIQPPEVQTNGASNGSDELGSDDDDWTPPEDLADLTLQCGRRGRFPQALSFLAILRHFGLLIKDRECLQPCMLPRRACR